MFRDISWARQQNLEGQDCFTFECTSTTAMFMQVRRVLHGDAYNVAIVAY